MISVCIPTIRPTTIEHAVRSIRQQTYCDWELVVVGQGDEVVLRAAVESASASDQRLRYIHSERRGLSIARNLGIRATTGEIVAFMDDDCEAAPDWLAQILFHSGPDIGLVGGSLVAPAKRKRAIGHCPHLASANATYDPMSTSTGELPGFGALGANIAVRRVAAEQVGGFDELLGAGAHFPEVRSMTTHTEFFRRGSACALRRRSS